MLGKSARKPFHGPPRYLLLKTEMDDEITFVFCV